LRWRGFPENRELRIGNIGWDENTVVAQLTKVLLEEDLHYGNVEIQQADLGLVFEGVRTGVLDTFQDVWLPNHAQLLSKVEGEWCSWATGTRARGSGPGWRTTATSCSPGSTARRTYRNLGRTRARTLMESGEDDRKESSDTVA
jgi:hypothetical protein